jgi:tetratricopeptide (TPR) repeat protein
MPLTDLEGVFFMTMAREELKKEIINTISSMIETGNTYEALQSIELYKNQVGMDADILCLEGIIAFIDNNYSLALELLGKANAMEREHVDSLHNLGVVHCKLGNYELANFYLKKAAGISPDIFSSDYTQSIAKEIEDHFPQAKHDKKRILIGSPVHQKPEILKMFLTSLLNLNKDDYEISYLFIDDNIEAASSRLLAQFQQDNRAFVLKSYSNDQYIKNNHTHLWNESLIWKVAGFKNDIIDFCLYNDYDFLFLIDSDLVLHPKTLNQLVAANKEIISNIFWTKWQPDIIELPQVWVKDFYTLYHSGRNEKLGQEEITSRTAEFLTMLRKPGIYKVGGLGACTLIARSALEKGVNFSEISNVSFWGEDRHFCIRAAALGIDLYVDTHYPAFHIYRDSDLELVHAYMSDSGYQTQVIANWV